MFLVKHVLKICSKSTGEHLSQSVILIKLLSNFIEITHRHGCSPVNLLHIFKTPFTNNTSGRLLLKISLVVVIFRYISLEMVAKSTCMNDKHIDLFPQ